jgi:site-specific recombinase XerD
LGAYQVRVLGKGKKERLVPFGLATQRFLRHYLTMRDAVAHDSDAFFLNEQGERLTRHAVTSAIKRLGKRAGIPRLHPHLLRHSAAVAYIMNGGDQFGLKRILGHSTLATTDGYMDYAQQHLAQQHKRFSPMAKVNDRRQAPAVKRKHRPTEDEGRAR